MVDGHSHKPVRVRKLKRNEKGNLRTSLFWKEAACLLRWGKQGLVLGDDAAVSLGKGIAVISTTVFTELVFYPDPVNWELRFLISNKEMRSVMKAWAMVTP